MVQNQGYAAYANNKILTASPAELVLMLYEAAIKFTNIAISAVEITEEHPSKDIEKAHENILKVEKIIEELQLSLDKKYPVAQDFDNVYQYIQQRLIDANISKDKEVLEEILKHLRKMRDTWKEVMKRALAGK
ncbi:flagellar export chaperone FliS [Lachnobacterium bovis]|jgi:flagellar protein FliS|uniref:Flagellar secretion chaperone FliS n=1 Tax=Lachnobacterium bovis DSM 14045 TaxID=1122142 RepID=A0A1H3GHK0_9FIRM|nr:flagellar export chaperone FliS [Lachnobacterium bovis]SDY02118.1 flagellar protein FliS [Lachnobacterium bovis DSM 14045]